jgi:hypothetical protein
VLYLDSLQPKGCAWVYTSPNGASHIELPGSPPGWEKVCPLPEADADAGAVRVDGRAQDGAATGRLSPAGPILASSASSSAIVSAADRAGGQIDFLAADRTDAGLGGRCHGCGAHGASSCPHIAAAYVHSCLRTGD